MKWWSLLLLFLPHVNAFSPQPSRRATTTSLRMNWWDDILRSFNVQDEDNNDDDNPAGTTRILTLPVQDIKTGGLRLFLMFYLMGQQNTPDPRSWRLVDDVSPDKTCLEYYYHDQSAILSVQLSEDAIVVDRIGSTPSNSYRMQETVVLDGLLHELSL